MTLQSNTRTFSVTCCAATLIAFIIAAAHADSPLAQYHNRNRVLVIFAPAASDARMQRERELLLQSPKSEYAVRDLVVIQSFATGSASRSSSSQSLRALYRVAAGEFRVLLIGKDGFVASSSSVPVPPSTLFAQIDRMPMRREEMRRAAEMGGAAR